MSITIDLDPELRVKRVPRNWNLERLTTVLPKDPSKSERVEWQTVGHYGSLESALRASGVEACDQAETVDDALKRMAAIGRRMDALFAQRVGER